MSLFERRRQWVNQEVQRIVSGTHMSQKEITKLLRKLWKQAKRMIK